MKITIFDGEILNPGSAEYRELESLGELTVYGATPDELVARCIGDSDIAFTDSSRITREVIDSCPSLRFIGILATGCNAVDMEYAARKGIRVCNAPGYAAPTVAQHGFALLLDLCGHIREHAEAVSAGKWDMDPSFDWVEHPQMELTGKTMGIVGFGDIGRNMARIAGAFGMKVLACRRSTGSKTCSRQAMRLDGLDETDIEWVSTASFDEIVEQADVISLNCPLREDNRHMIDGEVISRMKNGVMIINTARGGLIDESALAEALRSGKVAAAGLDVLDGEPPEKTCPLLGLHNCLITPHIGWYSEESLRRLLRISIDNLKDFLAQRS